MLFFTPPVDFIYDELVQKSYELQQQDLISGEITSQSRLIKIQIAMALFIFVLILSISPLAAVGTTVVFLIFPTIGLPLAAVAGEFAIYRRLSSLDTRSSQNFFSFTFCFLGISINASMVGVGVQNDLELFRGVKVSLVALPGWLFVTGFVKSVSRKYLRVTC